MPRNLAPAPTTVDRRPPVVDRRGERRWGIGLPRASAALRATLFAALFVATGCGPEGPRAGGSVRSAIAAFAAPASPDSRLELPPSATAQTAEACRERRPALVMPAVPWRWSLDVPPGARLHVGVTTRRGTARELEVQVVARDGVGGAVLAGVRRTVSEPCAGWLDFEVELGALAGRRATLELRPALSAWESEKAGLPQLAWGPVTVSWPPQGGAEEPDRPNLLVLSIDTLRPDHLGAYGYPRPTSPEIDRWLARRGVVAERVRAPAPWTLPTLVGLMSGRHPAEVLAGPPSTYALPADQPALAELLARAGYATAAFYANPALQEGNGFGRGFETLWTVPPENDSMYLHGEVLNRRAIPWLRAHANGPYFAFLHYLDPHDPYDSPLAPEARSPFLPEYHGPFTGDHVHGLFAGAHEIGKPADVEQIEALYDAEVRYVDQLVGAVLEALPEWSLRRTVVVLVADHGEELAEHGGWKHGRTLYEEQLRVPMIVRWDGVVPAGSRLTGDLRLRDLFATLLAAAGVEPPPGLDAVDLTPALAGTAPAPLVPLVVEHLNTGPPRFAAVAGRHKVILFDRDLPYAPEGSLDAHLYADEQARLAPVELYDLIADPGEQRDLSGERLQVLTRLSEAVDALIERRRPGLRLVVRGLRAGSSAEVTVQLASPPAGWSPYFLASGDTVDVEGARVLLRISGDGRHKGVVIEGEVGGVESARLAVDGAGPPQGNVFGGDGRPLQLPAGPAELVRSAWPEDGAVPQLIIWRPGEGVGQLPRQSDELPGLREALEALGYAG